VAHHVLVEQVASAAAEPGGQYEQVPSRVLIADDDRAIRESLARALELEGYRVVTVVDGVQALTRTRRDTFDALVVDVMMPGVDGLAVCRVLRAEGDRTPMLMLTARVETPDRVAGLDAGADDYLPKPFELDELLARLRALLRRAAPAPDAEGANRPGAALQIAALRVDQAARRAWWADAELPLSKTEFDLLELMVRNEGIVLDHSTIYQRIWGYDFGADSKNLAVYIGYLRRKLSAAGAPNVIHTVRGVGYTVRRP
jgi:two-component system, OmpR family, response regulator MprA